MLAKALTCAMIGLEGSMVEAEVDIAPGLPAFNIVGLPDTAVQEAKERVRAAIRNSGFEFPMRRITVNLAPADLKKAGPSYDLSIAVGILSSSGQITADISRAVFLGELSLDGSIKHVNGVLPMVGLAEGEGLGEVYVPAADSKEASLLSGMTVYPAGTLGELAAHLRGHNSIEAYAGADDHELAVEPSWIGGDLAYVRGQEHAKRALEVAAAGGHNLLMSGPPGSGKTLLARSLPSILPAMSSSESLDLTKIYSVAGLLPSDTPLVAHRPFRAPHYTISHAGLVGGGRLPRPGEVTLSHRGVLFLDELPEFGHNVLEVLRQPLEDQGGHHQQGTGFGDVSGQLHARGRHESLLLRLLRRPAAAVHLLKRHGRQIPEAHLRSAVGPHRHLRGSSQGGVRQADGRRGGGELGAGAGARGERQEHADGSGSMTRLRFGPMPTWAQPRFGSTASWRTQPRVWHEPPWTSSTSRRGRSTAP